MVQKKYQPVDRNIVVDIITPPARVTDDNRVILPDALRDNQKHGKWSAPIVRAVAVGPEVKYVKEGDYFLISLAVSSNALAVIHDGDELFVIEERGVVGVLTDVQVAKLGLGD